MEVGAAKANSEEQRERMLQWRGATGTVEGGHCWAAEASTAEGIGPTLSAETD